MKEPIQSNSSEVSIVIYDSPLPPRYFRLSKKLIRFTLIFFPIAIGLSLLISFTVSIRAKLSDIKPPRFEDVLPQQDNRISEMKSEIDSLKASNQALQEKLSGKGSEVSSEEPFLMGISKPYGMQNLISEKKVTVDQFEFSPTSDRIIFKFQIISTSPETKVSGHIIVFMISKNGVLAYPAAANNSIANGIKFSMGEPFSVSRLRPTNAEFMPLPSDGSVKFLVYIFNREGDLLSIKESQSYSITNK